MDEKKVKQEEVKEVSVAEKQLEFEKLSKDYAFCKQEADLYYQRASVFDTMNSVLIIPRLNRLKEEIEAENLKARVEQ